MFSVANPLGEEVTADILVVVVFISVVVVVSPDWFAAICIMVVVW